MSSIDYQGRIVVGTDLSKRADQAVEWAAARAAARNVGLLVVLVMPAVPIPKRSRLFDAMTSGDYRAADYLEHLREKATHRLAEVEGHLRGLHPDIALETAIVEGQASYVLAQASKTADMVVVGARGRGAPAMVRALGGTSDAVVQHAHGPVAVITDVAAPVASGPVVVGVDEAPEAQAAIRFAVTEAAARGVPLVAVHAWDLTPLMSTGASVMTSDAERMTRAVDEMVREVVAPLLVEHPEVELDVRSQTGRASSVLLEAAEGASLLVVGSRGRGGFAGLLLGSTSKEVLREASCPVVVVRA